MAFVKKGDVFVPEVLLEAIPGAFAGMKALMGTSAATVNTSMPHGKSQLGDIVKIPYFGTIGELDDLANDADALIPTNISTSNETATVKRAGKAFEVTDWARLSGVSDPYTELARQVAIAVQRRADQELINTAVADHASLLVKTVYSSTVPVSLSYDVMVDAKMLWGDEQDDIALMVVHSKVKGDLLKLKDSIGRPLLTDPVDGQVQRFCGIPVMVSDRLPVDTTVRGTVGAPEYTSLICKANSMVFWMNGTPSLKADADILADTEIAALHVYFAAHRYNHASGLSKSGVVRFRHN